MTNVNVTQYLDLLGRPATDKVTKFKGVVTSICFDLYGCVQAIVSPEADSKDGKLGDSHWFDVKRLDVSRKAPVLTPPAFTQEVAGPENKPAFRDGPR